MDASYIALIVCATVLVVGFGAVFIAFWRESANEQPKFYWRYSGLGTGERNFPTDLGCIASSHALTRADAIIECSRLFPRGSIAHIDDENHIITYKVVR